MSLVVITDSDLGEGVEEEVLEAAGHEVRRGACRSGGRGGRRRRGRRGADRAVGADHRPRCSRSCRRCGFVSRLGIGVDMVDLEAATGHGVAVANTPDYCIDEVVAHTLAFVLAATRGIVEHDRALRAAGGRRSPPIRQAARPSQRTVAVIGLGRIGSRVATQLGGLGYRRARRRPARAGARRRGAATLDERSRAADIVTLHLPLTAHHPPHDRRRRARTGCGPARCS